MAPVAEAVFYQDGKVLVTTTRVVNAGVTYSVANVTSVRAVRNSTVNMGVMSLGLVLGVFVALAVQSVLESPGLLPLLFGFVVAAAGFVVGFLYPKLHDVVFVTSGTEVKAITYLPLAKARAVRDAVGQAIAARG